jgi:hypothetical protein
MNMLKNVKGEGRINSLQKFIDLQEVSSIESLALKSFSTTKW